MNREKNCQAIASSTKERCQKKARLGSIYCFHHLPKTSIIFSLLAGAIIGALIDKPIEEAWRHFIPTQESRQLDKLSSKFEEKNKEVREIELFTRAIDEPIRNIKVLINFKKEIPFSQLIPINMAFELTNTRAKLQSFVTEIEDMPFTKHNGKKETLVSNYKIVSSIDNEITHSYMYGNFAETLSAMEINLPYRPEEGKPFHTIRDLNQAGFHPYFTQKMIDNIKDIRIIVNGWQLLAEDPARVHWAPWPINLKLISK